MRFSQLCVDARDALAPLDRMASLTRASGVMAAMRGARRSSMSVALLLRMTEL